MHPPVPSAMPASTVRSGWRTLLAMLLAAVMVTGCAGLPRDVHRPVSAALAAPGDTPLGQLVADQRRADGGRYPSGFLLLSGPQAAYGSRLALVEAARHTLDIQYYAIHADASTERLLLGVVAAARRGVRVRVLLDDFHSTGRDAQVMRLAFVPNVEMRMFNPLTGARGSPLGRMLSIVTDFSRVQQRMHNKLFVADNAMGVAGGRNLGDAYFGHAASGNFVDLDVLAAGPVVQDMSRSFDAYWNNERAYPVQSLISREELDLLRTQWRQGRSATPPGAEGQRMAGGTPGAPRPPAGDDTNAAAEQRARVWDQQPMDLAQARFVWAPAAVLVDRPAKIPADAPVDTGAGASADESDAATRIDTSAMPDGPSAPAVAKSAEASSPSKASPPSEATARTQPALPPSRSPPPGGDTVVDGLLQLMAQARRDLLIVSPYFVPGPDMKQAFAAALTRGVRVRVLTNSLASNDAPIAHAGYARHRQDLLAMGVELYEMRSELPAELRSSLGAAGSLGSGSTGARTRGDTAGGVPGASRAMLHSKLLVLDGQLLVVGSMNLDIRSQRQNTEIALLIRSRNLSARATSQIEAALRTAAWRVEAAQDGGALVWRAPEGSARADETTEPDASAPLRLLLQLLGPLAPDHLL